LKLNNKLELNSVINKCLLVERINIRKSTGIENIAWLRFKILFLVLKFLNILFFSELEAIGGFGDGGVSVADPGDNSTCASNDKLLPTIGEGSSAINTSNQPIGSQIEPAGGNNTTVSGNEHPAGETRPEVDKDSREMVRHILELILDVVVATAIPPRFVNCSFFLYVDIPVL
jgi:hypothetical protein